MMYVECEDCGAHLDPCEKCDCKGNRKDERKMTHDEEMDFFDNVAGFMMNCAKSGTVLRADYISADGEFMHEGFKFVPQHGNQSIDDYKDCLVNDLEAEGCAVAAIAVLKGGFDTPEGLSELHKQGLDSGIVDKLYIISEAALYRMAVNAE